MQDIREMIGKEVEVFAQGISYRGTLIEVSDTEVHLRTLLQWLTLPASAVGDIRTVERSAPATADRIIVEPEPAEGE